jgi:hypothetical protein
MIRIPGKWGDSPKLRKLSEVLAVKCSALSMSALKSFHLIEVAVRDVAALV